MRQIFIVLTGVSGNLGDAVIRRRVLEWSRGLGEIHAYLGKTTEGWVAQLGMHPAESTYRIGDRRAWLRKLLLSSGRKVVVFDPGEVPLGRQHLKSELFFLLLVAAVRLRGGFVFRPPRAVAHPERLVAWIYRASSRLSNVVLWRDRASLDLIRVGRLVPDTAFSEPMLDGEPWAERTNVIISMRGKREMPGREWVEGIATFAASRQLGIVVLSQVDEDELRSRELAELLGPRAEYVPWGDHTDLEQERAVRERYKSSVMVISDRLHVLILAAKAGSIPVELAPFPRPKVESHFHTIGYEGLSMASENASIADISNFLGKQLERKSELTEKLRTAEDVLLNEVESFRAAARGRA